MNYDYFCTRFSRYEKARRHLFCRLADPGRITDEDDALLSSPWMDLALCCYYDMSGEGMPEASVTIRRSCLSLWEVSGRKVLQDAMRNTAERQPAVFRPLERVLREMQGDPDTAEEDALWEETPLYLLSNEKRMFGAVFMAVPEVLGKIGEKLGSGYYIIPSSIHECLILPEGTAVRADELNALVSMINREYVAEKEVLADHVYYYDSTDARIWLC